jgi:membrane fusion protein
MTRPGSEAEAPEQDGRRADPEGAPTPLFRREAVAEQRERWLGSVLLTPRASHTVYTGVTALILAGVLGLFTFGEYTRKARMGGWLAPEQGLIQIVAPEPGVLVQLPAREGTQVAAGDVLAVLSAERRSETLGATQGEVVRQLRAQRDSLRDEHGRQRDLGRHEAEVIEARLAVIGTETRDLEREIALQRERRELAARAVTRQRELRDRNIATEQGLLEAEQDALDQAVALQGLERSRTALARARLDLEAERNALPLRQAVARAETDRAIAAIEQTLAETEAARAFVVTAPEPGTVTGVRAALGSSVGPDAPLMTLVPEGARLEARLYGPSRAIGLVRAGQPVRLRYDAFPHQKFGQYEGVVRSVSRTTVGTMEMPGADSLPGLLPGEPAYLVAVEVPEQNATAYGQPFPLQPGMQLEADVLIETRRLYEWILDLLHALTGGRG